MKMSKNGETPEQSQSLLFGLSTARNWLDKVLRERDRFLAETEKRAKTDHALNLAITLSHLEDWVHRLHVQGSTIDFPDQQKPEKWDAWVLQQCPAMLFFADLCNAAKHRTLHDRRSGMEKADVGTVTFITEDLRYAEDFIGRLRKLSTVLNVRTKTDDGARSCIEVWTETHKLSGPGGFRLFMDIANEAIRFWGEFLKARGI